MKEDKRKSNGGHSTKPKSENDKRLLTKAESEKANVIFTEALKEFFKVDTDEEAKKVFVKDTLMESQRGQLFIAEHIFGKAPQEIKQTNFNFEEKDLTPDEIKRIKNTLNESY